MVNESQSTQRKRRERSPSYPGIDLPMAINRLETLYGVEGRHFAPITAINEHWGYKQKSSSGMVSLAALIKYGLLEDRGSGEDREAKVTDLGLTIILPENERERRESIKSAALMPAIHDEIWTQYGGRLPSDASLRVFLIRQKHFNPSAVDDFIGIFRRTIEFAKLAESDKMHEGEREQPEGRAEEQLRETPDLFAHLLQNPFGESKTMPGTKTDGQIENKGHTERQKRIIQIPIGGDEWVALQLPGTMSETEWRQLFVVLAAMKPGLVAHSRIKPEDVPKEIEDTLQSVSDGSALGSS